MLEIPLRRFAARWVWMLASGGVIIWLQQMIAAHALTIDSWMKWLVAGACYTVVAVAVTLASSAVFYRRELRNSAQLVKAMLKR